MRALAVLALALVAAGCGGTSQTEAPGADINAGAEVFREAGCGDCHTFAAAGTTGKAGPDLDQITPRREQVVRQVTDGGNGMPAFRDRLDEDEIEAVAAFVSGSAAVSRQRFTFEPNATRVADCKSDAACLQQAFGNLAYDEGPRVALDKLESLVPKDPAIRSNCHPIAHMIGAGGLRRFDGNVGQAFAAGTAACGSGYYHGLLQWKLAGLSEERALEVAREACTDPVITTNRFNAYQCVHGLGHGLMLFTGYHLPDALEMCHGLEVELDQTSCTGGVFMENLSSSFGLKSRWVDDKNLLYPCTMVGDRDKLYCYLLVTSRILPQVEWDWTRAADWCRKSEPGWVDTCFQSYGRDAAGTARQDADEAKRYCDFAGSGERECVYGAVRDIMNNNARAPDARRLCEIVDSAFRSYCFEGIGTIVGVQYATVAERRTGCAHFARGRDLEDCVRGAG